MIHFKCPQCHQSFKAEDKVAGKKTKCPKCGTVLSVPNVVKNPVAGMPSVSKPAASKPSAPISANDDTSSSLEDLPRFSAGDTFGLLDELPPLPASQVGSFSQQPPRVTDYSVPARQEKPATATRTNRNQFWRFLGTNGGGNLTNPRAFGDRITERWPRLMGIVFIILGLIVAKLQIYDALHAAEQHRQQVTIYSVLVVIAIFGPAYGVLLLFFGRRPIEWFKIDPQNLSVKNTICLLLFGVIGLVAYILIMGSLESQGFHSRNGL